MWREYKVMSTYSLPTFRAYLEITYSSAAPAHKDFAGPHASYVAYLIFLFENCFDEISWYLYIY